MFRTTKFEYNPNNLQAPQGFHLATADEAAQGLAGNQAYVMPNGDMMWLVPDAPTTQPVAPDATVVENTGGGQSLPTTTPATAVGTGGTSSGNIPTTGGPEVTPTTPAVTTPTISSDNNVTTLLSV